MVCRSVVLVLAFNIDADEIRKVGKTHFQNGQFTWHLNTVLLEIADVLSCHHQLFQSRAVLQVVCEYCATDDRYCRVLQLSTCCGSCHQVAL